MAYSPIAFTAANYRDYKNYWLKAYEPGTTTPVVMATDSTLSTFISKSEVNVDGFLVSAGNALIIPHVNGTYDLWLFPTEAEAEANDTSNALRLADSITGAADLAEAVTLAPVSETVTLIDGQTVVTFTAQTTAGAEFHINGQGLDSRLLTSLDINEGLTTLATITLFDSYPAGALVTLSKNTSTGSSVVATVEEEVVLTDGQTVVTFSTLTTESSEFHINGIGVDSRLLTSEDINQSLTAPSSITLFESYPAGSIVTLAQNSTKGGINVDITNNIIKDLSQAYEFDTLQDAIVSTVVLPVGKVLNLKERSTGNGGGATWDVVLSSSVTENGYDIVQCTGVPTLSLVLRLQSIIDPAAFGATGDGATDDYGSWNAILSYVANYGVGVVSEGNKVYSLSARLTKTIAHLHIDLKGSKFLINYQEQAAPAINLSVTKDATVKNIVVDGQNQVHRPFAIQGTTTDVNITTENITVNNTYGIGVGTLSVIGVYIYGIGSSLSMTNTTINNVDSDVGRSSTAGIFTGRASNNNQGFKNVSILNTTLKNITEQGGSTITDSDGIKVFGPMSQAAGSPLKTNCIINGVFQWNETGLGCKRIVKTQCQQYDVSNITGIFSNCNLVSAIDNQYGSGSCDNVNLELDTVNVAAGIVNQPQFQSSTEPNDSGSSITNVSVQGTNCTADILTQAFFSTDRKVTRSYKNWNIQGFTYTNFGVIQSDNDDSFATYENINLLSSTITGDSAFLGREGQGASIERNYISASFINFQTDKIVFAVGLYSGDTTVWTRFRPTLVQNCTLQFMGYFGEVGRYFNRGGFENGFYDYKARLLAPKAGGVGSTTIRIRHDLAAGNNYQYQYVNLKYKQLQGNFISNSEFTVKWSSATACSAKEIVESFVGANRLTGPTATYTADTDPLIKEGDLVITWATDNTGTASGSIEILSTVDITPITLFGVAV